MTLLEWVFRAVIDTSWRAAWLLLLVLGVRWALRQKVSGRLLFGVWIVVGFRLLLPLSVPATWSPFTLVSSLRSTVEPSHLEPPALSDSASPAPSTIAADVLVDPSSGWISWMRGLSLNEAAALMWCLGILALLTARVVAVVRFAHVVRRTSFPPDHPKAAVPLSIARMLDGERVSLMITTAVSAPALFGIWRPRILLPPGILTQLSGPGLQHIIAHELAHVRRRDLLADAFLHLAAIVHWFNPVVWWAVHSARQDCEIACDESVLRGLPTGARECYGATLLRITQLTTEQAKPSYALGVVSSKKQIKRRIQMIAADRPFSWAGAFATGALSLTVALLSFTSASVAQVTPTTPTSAPGATVTPAVSEINGIVYNPSVDRLDALFPTGIVATVADRSITVADVRTHIGPLIPNLQSESRSQEEFNRNLTRVQNHAIKDLVDRLLLIRQFHDQREGEQPRQVAEEHVDRAIADEIAERFAGDRGKFLDYLRSRNLTVRQYRTEVEENIILNYARAQERRMSGQAEPPKPGQVQPDPERPIHLRMIELSRSDGESDAALLARANALIARFRQGEDFALLAREYDESKRRERGGDWGWLGPRDLKSPFRDSFMALQKGAVADPIITPKSCFILYAQDRR